MIHSEIKIEEEILTQQVPCPAGEDGTDIQDLEPHVARPVKLGRCRRGLGHVHRYRAVVIDSDVRGE